MKAIITSVIIAMVLIGGAVFVSSREDNALSTNTGKPVKTEPMKANNVSITDGKQLVELQAKGGYWPRRSVAQAGVPTTLRFNTNGTFDCSLYIRIPSLNLTQALPRTGSTDIDLGIQKEGVFRGSCGMGMYPFEIEFKS